MTITYKSLRLATEPVRRVKFSAPVSCVWVWTALSWSTPRTPNLTCFKNNVNVFASTTTTNSKQLVHDILPLEQGAGKRCSECAATIHQHKPGRDVTLVVLAESLPFGLFPNHAQLITGVLQHSLDHGWAAQDTGQRPGFEPWWAVFFKLPGAPYGFWLARLNDPGQDVVGGLHHLVSEWQLLRHVLHQGN